MPIRYETSEERSSPQRRPIEAYMFPQWTGGWRPDKQPSQLMDDEITDVQNLEYEMGGGVRKRGGFEVFTNAVAGLDNIEFLHAPRHYTTDGLKPILGQTVVAIPKNDGEIYYANFGELEEQFALSTGADFVDSTFNMGPASAGAFNHFRVWPINAITFEDKLYLTCLRYGGEDNGVTTNATEDGTATGATRPLRYDAQTDSFSRMVVADLEDGATTSPRFPRARCALSYHDRVFAANVHSQGDFRYPSRIYWSEPGDAETWETASWIAIGADDGTEITAMVPFGEQILIFKNNSMYAMVGTDEDTFAVYPLSRKLGTEGTWGATEGNGVAYFWDHTSQSMFSYDGARFDNIGQPVSEYVRQRINYNAQHKCLVQVFDNYLWFSYPKGDVDTDEDDKNTETLVYDIRKEVWTKWTFGVVPNVVHRYSDFQVDSGADAIEGDANPYFVVGDTTQDDHVMKGYMGNVETEANTVWTDAGSNYTFQFRTAWLSPDNGTSRKRARRLEVLLNQLSDSTDFDLYRDFINEVWTTVTIDALADTVPDLLEYHLMQSTVDVLGMWNWVAVDVESTTANECEINSIGLRYSMRPSPRGDVGGSQYHN